MPGRCLEHWGRVGGSPALGPRLTALPFFNFFEGNSSTSRNAYAARKISFAGDSELGLRSGAAIRTLPKSRARSCRSGIHDTKRTTAHFLCIDIVITIASNGNDNANDQQENSKFSAIPTLKLQYAAFPISAAKARDASQWQWCIGWHCHSETATNSA